MKNDTNIILMSYVAQSFLILVIQLQKVFHSMNAILLQFNMIDTVLCNLLQPPYFIV